MHLEDTFILFNTLKQDFQFFLYSTPISFRKNVRFPRENICILNKQIIPKHYKPTRIPGIRVPPSLF